MADINTKMGQIGKMALGTGSLVGTSVTGAIVGEILIPIPILGAVVGGLIGGYFGVKSNNYIFEKLDKNSFKKLYQNICDAINEDGSWIFDSKLMKIYGLKEKYFMESLPRLFKDRKNAADLWISTISYTLVTIFQSDQELKDQKKKEEE